MSTATLIQSVVNPGVISSAEPMETDEALYETVHGQRVEMPPMSIRAVIVTTRISFSAKRIRQAKGTWGGIHGIANPRTSS